MKAAKKKAKAKVPAGIFLKKSTKGISVHIHSNNGNKLGVLTGYNTIASAMKGLSAVHFQLIKAGGLQPARKYEVTDLTKPAPVKKAKKAAKKK